MSYLRSIMLAVRGSYQAGMAMRAARTDIQKLVKEQREAIRATQEMVQQSHQIIFAGAAFTVFGGLVTKGLMKLMESSQQGRQALFRFSQSTTESLRKISAALAPMFEHFLKLASGILEFVSASPLLSKIAAGLLLVAGPLLMLAGTIVLMGGSVKYLMSLWSMKAKIAEFLAQSINKLTATTQKYTQTTMSAFMPTKALTASVKGLDVASKSLAVTLEQVVSVLMIALTVITALKNIVGGEGGLGDVFALAGTVIGGALGIPLGPAGILAGAAVGGMAGGMLGDVIQPPSYASGTSFVKQGGLAVLHGGEEIKSAREGRFLSKMEKTSNQTTPSGPQTVGYYNIPISVENLNTKADIDDIAVKIKRALKDALDMKV